MSERVVVVNASKMNYDHALDFSVLSSDVQVYDDSTNEELIERIQGARVVVTKELPVGVDLLSQFPDTVKLIVEAGTGYNNIDLNAAKERGITVCNIPAYSTERVAHTVIMMILNFASTMQKQIGMLAKGDRSNFTKYLQVSHTEVNGKTLGVVGAGHIGMEVIKVAKALGMNILIHTRTPKADGDGVRYVSLDELLANSDYITLHCPLNDQTKHMINKETIAKMKPSAVIVNTGRGPLINEADLCEALAAKRIAGAGLDVQEVEPPAEDSPLYTLDNVIITPHMGWKGLETRQRLVGIIRDNVQAFFKGEPINVVSK
ncbi:D-2-hydroxyacid dehydrogenase [Veillonella sp. AM51-8BH]|uniref:2-hydroxyacid dehydrogenase n=1 Tax=Veillonella sp. AM51-8BH TaxID=2292378 RepID=UPI000E5D4DCC|nr:NAD(P)-dependent oxidoreductase [Veillonella sp. AM51-8BH]RGZ25211.1 D-2-hydroxyacid dehydrogenase [Veillonella sp. AM51-8BH]